MKQAACLTLLILATAIPVHAQMLPQGSVEGVTGGDPVQVTNDLLLTGDLLFGAIFDRIVFDPDADTYIRADADDDLRVHAGGNLRFRVRSGEVITYGQHSLPTGDFGVGTSILGGDLPTGWLSSTDSKYIDVRSLSTSSDSGIFLGRSDNGVIAHIWHDGGAGDLYIDNHFNAATADVRFRTRTDSGSPIDAMIIEGDGNVGIGITDPLGSLHVADEIVLQTFASIDARPSAGSDTIVPIFRLHNTDEVQLIMASATDGVQVITNTGTAVFEVFSDRVCNMIGQTCCDYGAQATAPGSPNVCDTYHDTTSDADCWYDGAAWEVRAGTGPCA